MEEEAKIIRIIYRLFLEGYAITAIASKLTDAGIPTPAKHPVWQRCTIVSILSNEKYYGAALMQKKYCVDFRTKQMVPNRGELPMYYIENDHEPIVTKAVFDEVQRRLQQDRPGHTTTFLFSHKLFCADCGGLFSRIRAHSTTYNDMLWRCGNRQRGKCACKTPYLYEEMLKPIFHEVVLSTIKQNPGIVRDCVSALREIRGTAKTITKNSIMEVIANHNTSNETEYRIWRSIIQKVVVYPGHLLEFYIIDGTIMRYQMIAKSPRYGISTGLSKGRFL